MEFKLIIKKLQQTLTPEEERAFQHWLNQSQTHRAYFEKVKKNFPDTSVDVDINKGWASVENAIDKIEGSATNHFQRNISLRQFIAAASVLIVLILSGYLTYTYTHLFSKHPESVSVNSPEHKDKVMLTLNDGTKVALGEGEVYHIDNLSVMGDRIVYKGCYLTPDKAGYNVLTVPRGIQFTLVLSDGTKVWLNSDTKIKYPNEFVEGRLRKVELLYGEACFKVSPSALHKGAGFRVLCKGQRVEVVGTEFNIKAYKDSRNIYTTLIEGVIRIENGGATKIMKPDYQAVVHQGNPQIAIHPVKVFNIIAWKRGYFSFDKTSLFEITKVLSRWYDVQFVFLNKNLEKVRYTGILDRKLPIKTILSIFQKTNDVDYEIKGKTIYIK